MKGSSRRKLAIPLLFCLFYVAQVCSQSQALDAQIEGVVTDTNGAAVVGANVTALNVDNGAVRATVTDVGGYFRIPLLTLGTYKVTAERTGFKLFERIGVNLTTSQTVTLNLALEAGALDEKVTVTADAAIADESKSEIGKNITAREVANLPLVSRNPFNFILLQPGTTGRSVGNPLAINLSSGGLSRRVGNHLDGALVNDIDAPGFRLILVSEVFVKEIQLLSRGYSAEFGGTSGVIVNIITPSGTNRHTGNAATLWRPSQLSSRSFGTSRDKPREDLSALGFTIVVGGPILKDRWHYYAGYESTVRRSLPEIAVTNANAASLIAAGLPASIFVNTNKTIDRLPYMIFRTDVQLTDKDRLSFRYNRFDADAKNFGTGGINTTERSFDFGGPSQAFAAQMVNAFSDRFFNEFRFLYGKRTNTNVANADTGKGASVLIRNVAAFGPIQTIGAVDTDQSSTQFFDSTMNVFGRHAIKIGGGVNFIHDQTIGGLFSLYEFASIAAYRDAVNGTNRRSYTRYTETFGEPKRPMDVVFLNAFVQDEWRTSRRLKINAGLRYELYRPPSAVADAPLEASRSFNVDKNNLAIRLGAAYLLKEGKFRTVLRAASGVHYDPLQSRFYRRARLNTGDPDFFSFDFTPNSPSSLGPEFPNRFSTLPANVVFPPQVVDLVSPDFKTMYAVNSSVQVETALTENFSIAIGYLHTAARHIPVTVNTNCLPVSGTLGDGRALFGAVTVGPNGDAVVSRQCEIKRHPQFSRVWMAESSGNLTYHGFIVQVTKRFSSGFQASASYTYSKARDDGPEDVPGFGNLRQTNPANRYLDHGASFGDVRHVFRGSLVTAPRFAFSNGAIRAILNGYQVAMIAFADSGEPFNITAGFDLNRDGIEGDRPVGIPRNAGRIPAFFGMDARLSRRFRFSERFGLEVYAEASNLFNSKSVASYTNTVLSATNVNTSVVNPLTGELRGSLPDFSSGLTNWRPARAIQLGFKVHF